MGVKIQILVFIIADNLSLAQTLIYIKLSGHGTGKMNNNKKL